MFIYWYTCLKTRKKSIYLVMKLGAIVGIISIIGYSSYFFALETGIASVVFPVVSLNCLVVVFVGCVLYKEKLKVYQVVGLFSALVGIVLTKI
ncbi:EamA family transporter [Bacillus sp. T3]|uniref:EamA family transporter n=1 Tax=Bacillus sp. T3 TaxID=467262 RepID=UPI002982A38B|nr:EamA family transporter [Bacillus sp. T3]